MLVCCRVGPTQRPVHDADDACWIRAAKTIARDSSQCSKWSTSRSIKGGVWSPRSWATDVARRCRQWVRPKMSARRKTRTPQRKRSQLSSNFTKRKQATHYWPVTDTVRHRCLSLLYEWPRDQILSSKKRDVVVTGELSLIHIWRCRRSYACRSRWSPYH